MTHGKGIQFERRLVQELKELGYSVMRGASSKGEAFGMKVDIIATKDTGQNIENAYMVLVQCKKNKKKESIMKKPKLPKKRSPVAKAASKMRTKIKPSKKKLNPPNEGYHYNQHPLFDGTDNI